MHKIVDLGIHEIDVYDLEVEGCHNFFANDILVHNSVYYQIQPYMDRYLKSHDLDLKGKIDFCVRFADKVTQPIIDKAIGDFTSDLNAYDPSFCGCKREIVADALVHCDKKRYYGRIRVDEATEFPLDEPHIKITGLEIVRSTTPKFTVTKINEAIDLLFDADEDTLKAWIAEMRKEFETAKIDDIAMIGSCSNLDTKSKATPIGVRASVVYNDFIQKQNLTGRFNPIQPNEKTKRVYLKTPNVFNSNIIAYLDTAFAEEYLRKVVDLDTMFDKGFLSAVKIMANPLNYNLNSTVIVDEW